MTVITDLARCEFILFKWNDVDEDGKNVDVDIVGVLAS
jgi:hypothetical protein